MVQNFHSAGRNTTDPSILMKRCSCAGCRSHLGCFSSAGPVVVGRHSVVHGVRRRFSKSTPTSWKMQVVRDNVGTRTVVPGFGRMHVCARSRPQAADATTGRVVCDDACEHGRCFDCTSGQVWKPEETSELPKPWYRGFERISSAESDGKCWHVSTIFPSACTKVLSSTHPRWHKTFSFSCLHVEICTFSFLIRVIQHHGAIFAVNIGRAKE